MTGGNFKQDGVPYYVPGSEWPSSITRGDVTVRPTLVLGYEVSSEVPTIAHTLLDGTVVHTLKPALPRTGTLNLLFNTRTAATEAWVLHRKLGPLVYDEPALPNASMKYVVTGALSIQLDPETRVCWLLTVPFSEVV